MSFETHECIIVGSGFVGTEIALYQQNSDQDFLHLEPSLHNRSAFSFDSIQGVFDANLAQKTIGLGGGANVWGNGMCFPTVENFFGDLSKINWHQLSAKHTKNDLKNLVTRPLSKTFRHSKRVLKSFRSLINNDHFLIEKHGYAGGKFGSSGWKNRSITQLKQGVLACKITCINFNINSQFWELTIVNSDKVETTLATKTLIFASGTLMNAFLVHLATGQNNFPLGSHFSALVGEVHLNKPQKIEKLLQTWHKNETEFSTISLSHQFRLTHLLPHSAIRFHPITELKLKDRWREIRQRPRPTLLISFLREACYHVFTGKYFYDQFQIHLLVDVPLSRDNFIEFNSTENCKARINLQHTNASIRGSRILLEQFLNSMSQSKKCKSINVSCVSHGVFDLSKYHALDWQDTAHYFGTIPMSDDLEQGTVNGFFELNGSSGIFVVGNSCFPTGSHSHPTLLSVLLAKIFCRIALKTTR
jgi:hypothetical protein